MSHNSSSSSSSNEDTRNHNETTNIPERTTPHRGRSVNFSTDEPEQFGVSSDPSQAETDELDDGMTGELTGVNIVTKGGRRTSLKPDMETGRLSHARSQRVLVRFCVGAPVSSLGKLIYLSLSDILPRVAAAFGEFLCGTVRGRTQAPLLPFPQGRSVSSRRIRPRTVRRNGRIQTRTLHDSKQGAPHQIISQTDGSTAVLFASRPSQTQNAQVLAVVAFWIG